MAKKAEDRSEGSGVVSRVLSLPEQEERNPWFGELRSAYRYEVAICFVLYGNVHDYVIPGRKLPEYLCDAHADRIIVEYDLASGVTFPVIGHEAVARQMVAGVSKPEPRSALERFESSGQDVEVGIPKDPSGALAWIENLMRVSARDGATESRNKKVLVLIKSAHMLFPDGNIATMSNNDKAALLTVIKWGTDPELATRRAPVIIMLADSMQSLHSELRKSSSKYEFINVNLPDREARAEMFDGMAELTGLKLENDYDRNQFVNSVSELNLIGMEDIFLSSKKAGMITRGHTLKRKKAIIKQEYGGLLETYDNPLTFADLFGCEYVKPFLMKYVVNPLQVGDARLASAGVLMIGPPGCLAKDTPVMMFDGTVKPVQDIVVGDLLMGPDSMPRGVLSLCRGRETMYRVTPVKGDPYVVNGSHILSLKMNANASFRKKGSVVNIAVGDYLSSSATFKKAAKGWRTGVEFIHNDVPVDPYILGVWLGDGSNGATSITTPDPEIVSSLEEYASRNSMKVVHYGNKGLATTYGITNGVRHGGRLENRLLSGLRSLGVMGNKHIPHVYKCNSRRVRLELLAGLIDTDGHLSDGGYEISSKYGALSADILFLARSLGFAAYRSISMNSCPGMSEKRPYCRIYISGDVCEIPVRVRRKACQARKQRKNVLHTGISLEEIGVDDYYGFVLDGDHLFLLGDFTVTHNTGKSHIARCAAGAAGVNFYIFNMGAIASMWQGEGEKRAQRALSAVSDYGGILFIDEINNQLGGGSSLGSNKQDARIEGILMEWLADPARLGKVCVLAATNRPEEIKPELKRPGRFDHMLGVFPGDADDRIQFLSMSMRRRFGADVEFDHDLVASLTERPSRLGINLGWTNAELGSAVTKAYHIFVDTKVSPGEALISALKKLKPSTQEVEEMTYAALRNINDADLLPKYLARFVGSDEVAQEGKRPAYSRGGGRE